VRGDSGAVADPELAQRPLARRFEDLPVPGSTLIGASPVAMFSLTSNRGLVGTPGGPLRSG